MSEVTLSIVRELSKGDEGFKLYAITPYAYEYVRKATVKGVPGLARDFIAQALKSLSLRTLYRAVKAVLRADVLEGVKALVDYEVLRVRSACRGKLPLTSLMIHEVVTDALAAYSLCDVLADALSYIGRRGIPEPGVETRNAPHVVRCLREYLDPLNAVVATPFNKVGYQMAPSREAYEELVRSLPGRIIAMSALAAGYLRPREALSYLRSFRNYLRGAVFGVSRESHAVETFTLARQYLKA